MKTTIHESFHRNGQLRERVPLRDGLRHGTVRTWHRNGRLASEEPFRDGLLHGICRQWNEAGRLLGKYQMVHGTGIQRVWHNNGRLQMEISTIRGEFTGRNRTWLRDGTLYSERYCLRNRDVSAREYRAAAAGDKSLPRYRGRPARLPPASRTTLKHVLKVFVLSLLEKPNRREARKWLTKKAGDRTLRSLGRFKRERDAAKFVAALYEAGAVEVIAPDIYRDSTRGQFSDCLLVQLPKSPAKRVAVRRVCAQLRSRALGAVQPESDIGERHLYLSLF